MKKSSFIIAEIILSAVFLTAAASVGILAADINSNGKILDSVFSNNSSVQQESSANENKKPQEESVQVSEQSKTESKTESSTPSATQNLQIKEPKNLSKQPKELTQYIKNYGYDYDYMNFDHLIVAVTDKTEAKLYCYQKSSNGYWWNIAGDGKAIADKCYIGEKGADFEIKEGSKITPLGFYQLGSGFYIDQKPSTNYPMFQITDDTYWVDDPKSKFYNQKVEGTSKKDWSSADHMITVGDRYKYGLVINYNTDPIVAGKGSEIFLHCGTGNTAGSIALPEETMKAILEWLDKDSNAYIFITL